MDHNTTHDFPRYDSIVYIPCFTRDLSPSCILRPIVLASIVASFCWVNDLLASSVGSVFLLSLPSILNTILRLYMRGGWKFNDDGCTMMLPLGECDGRYLVD